MAMVLTMLSGCGGEESTSSQQTSSTTQTTAQDSEETTAAAEEGSVAETSAAETVEGADYEPITYPLEETTSFTYYMIKDLGQASNLAS